MKINPNESNYILYSFSCITNKLDFVYDYEIRDETSVIDWTEDRDSAFIFSSRTSIEELQKLTDLKLVIELIYEPELPLMWFCNLWI